jgi:anamorsin
LITLTGAYLNVVDQFTARKPSSEALKRPRPPPSANGAAVPLRLRSRNNAAAKAASLWKLTQKGSESPTIDESSLLTHDDLKRRETIQRPDCDVKRTRKACKNCSCGLSELLLEEKDDLPASLGGGKSMADDQEKPAIGAMKTVSTGAVTSSCGSCYLGDAFRCASCPYLGMVLESVGRFFPDTDAFWPITGLPAFEPGQKVEIGAGLMSDDI